MGLLCERADTVFTLPNERLLQTLSKSISFRQALAATDHVVRQATQTILDLVAAPGLINLDFAVVRAVLANAGSAFLGTGRACSELRALEAIQQAISSPLLEAAALEGAKDVLINITGGSDESVGSGYVPQTFDNLRQVSHEVPRVKV